MKDLLRAYFRNDWGVIHDLATQYTDPDKFETLSKLVQHKGNRKRLYELELIGPNAKRNKA